MTSPWLETFLIAVLIAAGFAVYFGINWFVHSRSGFKVKTFIVRFFVAPIAFIGALVFNVESDKVWPFIVFAIGFAILDRLAAYFDRNVPETDPMKYR